MEDPGKHLIGSRRHRGKPRHVYGYAAYSSQNKAQKIHGGASFNFSLPASGGGFCFHIYSRMVTKLKKLLYTRVQKLFAKFRFRPEKLYIF